MNFTRTKSAFIGVVLLACQGMGPGALAQGTDEGYALAMQAYEDGHYAAAADLLRTGAAAHHLRSLEVLGLMHWYGLPLYGDGAWDKATGYALLHEAAGQGSEVAVVVLQGARRGAATRHADTSTGLR